MAATWSRYRSCVTEFVNEPLRPESLPQLRSKEFIAVDRNLLRVSLLGMAIFAVLVAVAGGLGAALLQSRDSSPWVPLGLAGAVLLLIAIAAVLRVIEVRHIAYQVRTHDLSYRSGVWVRRVSTVPFVRVQHARLRQGPIQRRFSIATLEVNSAGPDLKVHGLPAETAEQLKALVIERAGDLAESP